MVELNANPYPLSSNLNLR